MAITISENEIEEWAHSYIHEIVHPDARIIGRQVTLPSGRRVDLLACHQDGPPLGYWVVTVVEVKAVRSDVDELLQLLGYMRELKKGEFANTRTEGVLLAPEFSGRVMDLLNPMEGVRPSLVQAELTFSHTPLNTLRHGGEPDWYAEEMHLSPWSRAHPTPGNRECAVRDLLRRPVATHIREERARRGWSDDRRATALVPARLSPRAVFARSLTNGRGG